MGYTIVLRIGVHAKLNNNHYGQWVLNPNGAPVVLTSATPDEGEVGDSISLAGEGFTGATSVVFGSTPATVFTVVSDTAMTVTVPAGVPVGVTTVRVARGSKQSATIPFEVVDLG